MSRSFTSVTGWVRLALLSCLGLAAVGSTVQTRAADQTVKIGVPTGLSGPASVVGPSIVQAAKLAVSEINAHGGILGHQIELAVADDGSGADGAV